MERETTSSSNPEFGPSHPWGWRERDWVSGGSSVGTTLGFFSGAALGAAAMYLLDPDKGQDRRHHLADLAGDTCTVGISQFAADQLQDITYIKLPTVGATVRAEASIGEGETVKAVSDLYAPVSGDIVAVNGKVADNPELMKNDPLGEGWIVKIRVAGGETLNHLLDAAAYQKQIESEDCDFWLYCMRTLFWLA